MPPLSTFYEVLRDGERKRSQELNDGSNNRYPIAIGTPALRQGYRLRKLLRFLRPRDAAQRVADRSGAHVANEGERE
jgi:hypothetical protein